MVAGETIQITIKTGILGYISQIITQRLSLYI